MINPDQEIRTHPGAQNTGGRSGSSEHSPDTEHDHNHNEHFIFEKNYRNKKVFKGLREKNTEWILAQMMEGWRTDPAPAQVFFREYEARKVE